MTDDQTTPGFDDVEIDTEPLTAVDDLNELIERGQTLGGRYRLDSQLAHRGTTTTWRAHDDTLSRSVLIHILPPGDRRTDDVLAAARGAAIATDSRYLRVLDALEAGPSEPVSFVVCEFSLGESLKDILTHGSLSALSSAWLVRELADALSGMHARGLFHRRLSPDTVIITTSGNVKIVGFLIDAALYPDPDEDGLAFSELEELDVIGLGKVLYACLTGVWPIRGEKPQIHTWGLPPAPRLPDGRLKSPSEVRSGVSPVLDAVCMQILDPKPESIPLRTAREIANALSKVLGSAEATDDLEARVRLAASAASNPLKPEPKPVVNAPVTPEPGPSEVPDVAPGSLTLTMSSPPPEDDVVVVEPPARRYVVDDDELEATQASSEIIVADDDWPVEEEELTPDKASARRWFLAAVALVLFIAIAWFVLTLTGGDKPGGISEPGALKIAAGRDFDPALDGGSGDENPDQVPLAFDGDPATSWNTVSYVNSPAMGGLKPGAGIILDLGKARTITEVKLTLVGEPTNFHIRVPGDDPTGDAPPLDTVNQWRAVTDQAGAPAETSLTFEPTETRWVMVYLTGLPQIAPDSYQGGVADVVVIGD